MYEVQTLFGNTWENCWTVNGKPEVFRTKEQAQTALDEFNNEMAIEVKHGNIAYHDSTDYRISEVKNA